MINALRVRTVEVTTKYSDESTNLPISPYDRQFYNHDLKFQWIRKEPKVVKTWELNHHQRNQIFQMT